MSHFRDFEKQAVRMLATPRLGNALVETVLEDSEFVAFEHTGVGYFLTVRHPLLPMERAVFDEPTVVGRIEEYEGGYLVFVENHELMLECYSTGAVEVPADFRERRVNLATGNRALGQDH
ncbi:hypothetical protein [Polaromonas aquatica]|uniref:hypothetical protein n=1 Tax=Polaromonas aquatica TaxID=332657 RepID=UPI003D65DDF7